MNKSFYIITVIVFFIFFVVVMNFVLDGGNQAVRVIFRYVDNNPRVAEISEAYRRFLLGPDGSEDYVKEQKDKETKKKKQKLQNAQGEGVLGLKDQNLPLSLPRDPEIGHILDMSLSRMEISNLRHGEVLTYLAGALNMPREELVKIYTDIVSVPYILSLSQEERDDPVVVEIFLRRDRIQSQIAAGS